MKNLRGNHTSMTPLSKDILYILKKDIPSVRVAPGLITRKNIRVKQVSIKLKDENTSIAVEVLMKGSKQYLRIYNGTLTQIKNSLRSFCIEKQIVMK